MEDSGETKLVACVLRSLDDVLSVPMSCEALSAEIGKEALKVCDLARLDVCARKIASERTVVCTLDKDLLVDGAMKQASEDVDPEPVEKVPALQRRQTDELLCRE